MILVIDNYDSFTWNLVQYLAELGAETRVIRNDELTMAEIERLRPERILISPGPGTPAEAGLSREIVRVFGPRLPLFGVCLGHQCIGEVFGGRVVRAARPMHGKTSMIRHDGQDLLRGMENPFEAIRYHSLLVERDTLPPELRITADTSENEIMGLRHVTHPIYGVQFHPESILTRNGKRILQNFMEWNG